MGEMVVCESKRQEENGKNRDKDEYDDSAQKQDTGGEWEEES